MRTVLCGTAGRAALILACAGMVGSVVGPAAPASAATRTVAVNRHAFGGLTAIPVQIGTALAYEREP
ncbi:MAG: hypothetical protein ACYCO3_13150, partial [Mycobacteriales bacterium]